MAPRGLSLGLLVIWAVSFGGCGEAVAPAAKSVAVFKEQPPASSRFASPYQSSDRKGMAGMAGMAFAGEAAAAPNAPGQDKTTSAEAPVPPAIDRKIVYTAQVEMNVEGLNASEKKLLDLVEQSKGYLSQTNINSSPGSPRRGVWKVRIPVETYGSFMSAVVKIGELLKTDQVSEEVTAEFYDLEVRIKNKQQEEIRLKKILEESTGKLKDILDVEKEISRVRGEIEQMQGRLRVLAGLTSLSTITVTMTEVQNFKPAERPTFAQLIGRTFTESTERLRSFLGQIVLAVVSFIPWLSLWVPLLAALWVAVRVLRRWLRSRSAGEPAIPGAVTS